ncbi:hypothetical protein ACFY94_26030 [Streptomyces griseorubiginosus]|uniref:hypothetical protein n=1 Tax=Streptomyces griseorubiginosus TaxID=67304 RepID=UPI0036E0D55E
MNDDMPVLVLARADPPPPLLPQAARLTLELIPRDGVIAYLNALTAGIIADPTVPLEHRIAWQRVRNLFTSGGSAALTYLLSRPLYLDLLVRTGRRDASLPVRFLDAVRHGREAGKKVLYTSFVDDALGARSDLSHRRAGLARRLAFQMAKEMSRTPTLTMAWGRLYMRVPPPVFGAAMAPLTAPAYQLCLFMPAGMTRGFALGTVTGVVLGMCRGVSTRSPACVATAVAGSGLAIMAVGTVWVGWRIAVVDTVEIAPAVGLVFWARHRLAADSWHSVTATVAAAGVGSAVMTCAVAAALAQRRPPALLVRRLHGGVHETGRRDGLRAAGAPPPPPPHTHADLDPATATFQLKGNPLPHLVAASTAAAAVAVAGGFVGGWSRGWTHGEHVGLFFGAVVGPGIGLAGGLIRWLNQPGPEKISSCTPCRDR